MGGAVVKKYYKTKDAVRKKQQDEEFNFLKSYNSRAKNNAAITGPEHVKFQNIKDKHNK
jgi:hypothetical protein